MNFLLLFIFFSLNLFLSVNPQLYQCPNYKAFSATRSSKNKKVNPRLPAKCNYLMNEPKKVINPYKNGIRNYVESKPFGSVCLKCSMCLAVAKEIDKLFRAVTKNEKKAKQAPTVKLLMKHINSLCNSGFENYNLRKVNQYQVVSDEVFCSSHVRTKMDGHWTEKLREMCMTYANSMDVQTLMNEYFKGKGDITNFLCSNGGIFRDCANLDFKNTTINPNQRTAFTNLC